MSLEANFGWQSGAGLFEGTQREVLERSESRQRTVVLRRVRSHFDVHAVCKLIVVPQGRLADAADPP